MDDMKKATHVLRVLSGTALLIALAATTAWAQQPAATPSPSPQKKSADAKSQNSTPKAGEAGGDYNVTSSIEIGYRGLRVGGDLNKYQSDLNYKTGPRLFDSSFLMQAKPGAKGQFLDSLLVTSTGWGGDPYGHVLVSAENSKWFRFDGQFRRFKYFNFLDDFANPKTANQTGTIVVLPNPVTGKHGYNVEQKMGDFNVTILPKNDRISFNFGYSPERYSGLTFTTYHAYGAELFFPANTTSRANDFRVGADWKLGPVSFSLLQGFRRSHDDSVIDFTGAQTSYLATTTTNLTTVNGYAKQQPVNGSTDYTRFSAHTFLARKLDITGRFIYNNSNTTVNYLEDVTGANINTRVTGAPSTGAASGALTFVDNTKRPNVVADFGVTFLATGKLRLSNTFRFESFHINGLLDYGSVFNLTNKNGSTFLLTTGNSLLGQSNVSSFRKITDTVEGDYQFNDRYAVHFGYRYGTRRETDFRGGFDTRSYTPTAFPATSDTEENHTNVFFGGFKIRPVNSWTLFFDAERGTADNIFTRVGEYNYTNFRARSRYAPNRKLALNFSVVTRDNSDPTIVDGISIADFGVSFKSRVFTSSVDYSPNARLSFSGGYNYNWVNSDAIINYAYAVPPFATGAPGTAQASVTGHSLYFVRNSFFYFDTVAHLFPRWTLYAAYRINKDTGQGNQLSNPAPGVAQVITSYPMSYQSPEARLSFRFNRRLEWNAGYQYYAYNESDLIRTGQSVRAQNYHAHLPYVSLRIYFGGEH
jgi:hypothetical protein